jgi:hypothetical protein
MIGKLFWMKPASGCFLFGRDLLAPLPSQELPWKARDEMQRLREDEGGFWRGKYVKVQIGGQETLHGRSSMTERTKIILSRYDEAPGEVRCNANWEQ